MNPSMIVDAAPSLLRVSPASAVSGQEDPVLSFGIFLGFLRLTASFEPDLSLPFLRVGSLKILVFSPSLAPRLSRA